MTTPQQQKPFRIGMIGAGTVGGGVVQLLQRYNNKANGRGAAVEICKICVSSLDKQRDFECPSTTEWTTDASSLYTDDTIDCVVEVMGGTGLAKTVVMESLKKGKMVVTANKALLATSMDELQSACLTTQGALLAWEAAVCGGIPIIHVLQTCHAGDEIRSLQGIMNGTTNYMLCNMRDKGASYADVLKEAQDLGFAEADPTADVDGYDVQAKLCLLTKLATPGGVSVPLEQIPCAGIRQVQSVDFENAQNHLNATIKLIGTCLIDTKNNDNIDQETDEKKAVVVVSAYVSPTVVPVSHALAQPNGPGNAVLVTSRNLGDCSYTGPGAGRFPTANSVVADILRCASAARVERGGGANNANNNEKVRYPPPFPEAAAHSGNNQADKPKVQVDTDYAARFYVRLPATVSSSQPGDVVQAAADKRGIAIRILPTTGSSSDDDVRCCCCFTTNESCKRSQLDALVAEIIATTTPANNSDDDDKNKPFVMPIIA